MSVTEQQVSPSKKDANDYSRFEFSDDDDDDGADTAASPSTPSPTLIDLPTFHENLGKSLALKESGNAAFKENNLADAKQHYESALLLLKPLKESVDYHPELPEEKISELTSTYVSVMSNKSMVLFKEEKWTDVIQVSNDVLTQEADNLKALYRRSVAYHRTGYLEESKMGLNRVLELDETNKAARKELVEVIRAIKEKKQKEKASMSSAFSSGSMYSDREEERQRKIRKAQEEEERLQDEWIKDKLKRRKEGDDSEITFDEWKKQKQKAEDDEKKRIENEEKAKRKAQKAPASTSPKKKPKAVPSKPVNEENDDDVYDEEDNKIINETTSKGYCYFKRELPTEEKQLIGDITPKAATALPAAVPISGSPATDTSANSGSVTASSWNHAGTWEERDMTSYVKDRLKEVCAAASAVLAGGMDSENTSGVLEEAMKSLEMPSSQGNPMESLERMSAALSTARASVTDTSKIEGDAQIVLARGKKRHCFDFNVTLKFDVELEDIGGDSSKNKKFKGTLEIHDFAPGLTNLDARVSFKKAVSPRVEQCAEFLRENVCAKLREFEAEYKAL